MKMEGIELYPHNQKAYDNLCAMLRDSNRACVVQPTGTGKFVIIAKMAQDNPGKNFLLLGTNDYMYIDQMANLSDIAPGFTPKNLQFMTYATAMAKARRGDEIPRCDVIVADEFHHCGAPEWGKGVQYVVENNPDAKIVGFSATPIRYSDKGRNMADEMFVGNIASSMELEEAWLDGVLPMPKYVIALYDAPKELGELKVSIEKVPRRRNTPNSSRSMRSCDVLFKMRTASTVSSQSISGSATARSSCSARTKRSYRSSCFFAASGSVV